MREIPPLAMPPLSLLVLYIAAAVEKCDEQVLPAVFFFLGRDLAASVSQLGTITLARAAVQAATSPLSGLLSSAVGDRTLIIAAGCALWGIATSAIGAAASVGAAAAAAAANGLGLALVVPALTSLVADVAPPGRRGATFGIVNLLATLGGGAGALAAMNLGGITLFGLAGWRAALHAVAAASLAAAWAVRRWASDPAAPAAPAAEQRKKGQGPGGEAWWHAVRAVLRVKSVQVIIAQGCIGTMPWVSLSLLTVWLQLLGFTPFQTSLLAATFALGCAAGGAAGGTLGDAAATRFPRHGRILIAQASVAAGLPLSALVFKGLPLPSLQLAVASEIFAPVPPGAIVALYVAALLAFALTISWCGANNSALFADLVPESRRTHVYAFDRSFEGAVGSCGAPLVGIAAARLFGFSGSLAEAAAAGPAARGAAARALSSALLTCLTVPWTACLCLYCLLHWTYPVDRAAAMKEARGGEAGLEEGGGSSGGGGAAAAVAARRRATADA